MSSVKFLLALPLAAFQYEFSFWQTFLLSSIGGLLGIFVFAYLSHFIIDKYSSWMSNRQQENSKDSIKKVVAVKTVKKYGLFGIAFLTPIFFSIPLGTFMPSVFFPTKRRRFRF